MLVLGGLAAASDADRRTQYTLMNAGSQVGLAVGAISFSKEHEAEADYVSAYMLERAGYDLEAAETLWVRMTRNGGHMRTGLLDTHPSGPDRLARWRITRAEIAADRDKLPNLAGETSATEVADGGERRSLIDRLFGGDVEEETETVSGTVVDDPRGVAVREGQAQTGGGKNAKP